jgi:HK97 family phage major capsid protein
MKTPPFNIAALVRSILAGTHGKIESNESRAIADEIERHGHPDNGYMPVPCNSLNNRAAPLTTAGANGGYLTQTDMQGYLQALQPQTNLLRLGAAQVPLDKNTTVTPAATALAPTWSGNESTPVAAVTNTYSQKTFVRKQMFVCVPISLQLLKQSNAQELVIGEAIRAAGAEADKQGIMGIGGSAGTPVGLLSNPLITSTSGAALAYSTLVAMMSGVANANAVVDATKLGFLTTPTVAGVLKQRYTSAANLPIWTGAVPGGTIDNQTALSSTNVPTGALIHGDFSRLLVAQWEDGLQIDLDPFTQFQSAIVTIRLAIAIDFVVASAASFQILTGVT